MTESKLENDRVCGFHFHSGKAHSLWDKFNLDWVPSLHLGHSKLKSADQQEKQQERAQRVRERRKRERECEEQVQAVKEKKAREDESEAHGDRIRDISFAVQDGEDLAEVPDEEEERNNITYFERLNIGCQKNPPYLNRNFLREMTVKFAFTLGYPRGKF